jgi:hypothetical protein
VPYLPKNYRWQSSFLLPALYLQFPNSFKFGLGRQQREQRRLAF